MPDDTSLGDTLSDASQPFARRSTPIGLVADMMVETGIGRIPIVDEVSNRVIGILSRHDLLKARQQSRSAEMKRGGAVG